ncbi:MAG: selenoneine biosynthesis selenosugar synthase SenB [Planctomycetota bacterium]
MRRALIVSPAGPDELLGNSITAVRWQRMLDAAGLETTILEEFDGGAYDLLVALHAVRSAPSVERFAERSPGRPIVVALTGTDLYVDLGRDPVARRTLARATRIVVLQEAALDELTADERARAVVVHQSVDVAGIQAGPRADAFQACVVGHLRPVKDPLLAARAARLAPESSRLRVVHLGRALLPEMADAARREARSNPRYAWEGELPREEALSTLAGSDVHVLTSRSEGGANVVGEATALGVPTLSTEIPGSIGLLGADHPGYFPVGDEAALAALLQRAESDPDFLGALRLASDRRAPLFHPDRERAAWRDLVAELDAVSEADSSENRT